MDLTQENWKSVECEGDGKFRHRSARSTPAQVMSDKLRLSFEKFYLRNQAVLVKNRINKLLCIEKEANKEIREAKIIVEEIKQKKNRNVQKSREKDQFKLQKIEKISLLKERVQYERMKRAENIKKLELNIVKDKQNFAKKLKESEKEWMNTIKQFKQQEIEEKYLNKTKIQQELMRKKQERSISQMSKRQQVKEKYHYLVKAMEDEKEIVKQNLEELTQKKEAVLQYVTEALKNKEEKIKQIFSSIE